MILLTPIVSRYKTKPYKRPKNKKLALNLGIETYQILTNDDEVCIPSLSSILIAVLKQIKIKSSVMPIVFKKRCCQKIID